MGRYTRHCEEAVGRRSNPRVPRLLRPALWALLAMTIASSPLLADEIKIVTTTSTLASIAREVAGEEAEIHYVASPKRNIHFITSTPRDVLRVKKAGIFIHVGLDLELWRDPLVEAAANPALIGQGKSAIDASQGIALLEVPAFTSRAEGDIHLYGNPHYWTDPVNAKKVAENIAEGLARNYPEEAGRFRENASAFNRRLDEKLKEWQKRITPFKGTPVVTYHKSWPYFAERFGFEVIGQLEPKPGIPPTAKHLAGIIRQMKEKGVKILIKETYQESRTPNKVAKETGARVLTLLQHVGEVKEAADYLSMMEYNIRQLEEVLKQ